MGKANQAVGSGVASYTDGGKSLWVNLGFAATNFSSFPLGKTKFNQDKTK
jgi:hypothetical protein